MKATVMNKALRAYDRMAGFTKIPSKRVYICSPLKGNVEKNTANAVRYCRYAFDKGFVPICPHIFYPQFLDNENLMERAAGIRYGLESMWQAREIWVFGDEVNDTEGMKAEIELAEDLGVPVRRFYDYMGEIGEFEKD